MISSKKVFLIIPILLIPLLSVLSQNKISDSRESNPELKLNELYQLFHETYKDSFHLGVKYAEETLVISRKTNNLFYKTAALIYIAQNESRQTKLLLSRV